MGTNSKEYMRNYQKKKYHTDEKYRKWRIKRSMRYNKEHPEKVKIYNKKWYDKHKRKDNKNENQVNEC